MHSKISRGKIWAFKNELAIRSHSIQDEMNGTAFRSPFARDRDRILYSKPLRRLAHKTQVFLTSNANHNIDEHCRTRLTHTLEVAQIAKSISNYLSLNTELTEAIAFGHDVGHAPFGHAGEKQIDDFLNGMEPIPREVFERIPGSYSRLSRQQNSRIKFGHAQLVPCSLTG